MRVKSLFTGTTAGVWLSLFLSCSNTRRRRKPHCLRVKRSLCPGDYRATWLKGGIFHLQITCQRQVGDGKLLMCLSVLKDTKEVSQKCSLKIARTEL